MRHLHRTAAAAALTACTVLAGLACGTPAAQAADNPTPRELLDLCGLTTDVCTFHQEGSPVITQLPPKQVGKTTYNCGDGGNDQYTVKWSEKYSDINSIGIQVGVSVDSKAIPFLEVFKAEVGVTYGHTWGTETQTEESTPVKIPPGYRGWVTRAQPMQTVHGTYELHFQDAKWGHYWWYVDNFSMTGPASTANGPLGAVMAEHAEPMTPAERAANCPAAA